MRRGAYLLIAYILALWTVCGHGYRPRGYRSKQFPFPPPPPLMPPPYYPDLSYHYNDNINFGTFSANNNDIDIVNPNDLDGTAVAASSMFTNRDTDSSSTQRPSLGCVLFGDPGCQLTCNFMSQIYDSTVDGYCIDDLYCKCNELFTFGKGQVTSIDYQNLPIDDLWRYKFGNSKTSLALLQKIKNDQDLYPSIQMLLRNPHRSARYIKQQLMSQRPQWSELQSLRFRPHGTKGTLLTNDNSLNYDGLEKYIQRELSNFQRSPICGQIRGIRYIRRIVGLLKQIEDETQVQAILRQIQLSGNDQLYHKIVKCLNRGHRGRKYGYDYPGRYGRKHSCRINEKMLDQDDDDDEIIELTVVNKVLWILSDGKPSTGVTDTTSTVAPSATPAAPTVSGPINSVGDDNSSPPTPPIFSESSPLNDVPITNAATTTGTIPDAVLSQSTPELTPVTDYQSGTTDLAQNLPSKLIPDLVDKVESSRSDHSGTPVNPPAPTASADVTPYSIPETHLIQNSPLGSIDAIQSPPEVSAVDIDRSQTPMDDTINAVLQDNPALPSTQIDTVNQPLTALKGGFGLAGGINAISAPSSGISAVLQDTSAPDTNLLNSTPDVNLNPIADTVPGAFPITDNDGSAMPTNYPPSPLDFNQGPAQSPLNDLSTAGGYVSDTKLNFDQDTRSPLSEDAFSANNGYGSDSPTDLASSSLNFGTNSPLRFMQGVSELNMYPAKGSALSSSSMSVPEPFPGPVPESTNTEFFYNTPERQTAEQSFTSGATNNGNPDWYPPNIQPNAYAPKGYNPTPPSMNVPYGRLPSQQRQTAEEGLMGRGISSANADWSFQNYNTIPSTPYGVQDQSQFYNGRMNGIPNGYGTGFNQRNNGEGISSGAMSSNSNNYANSDYSHQMPFSGGSGRSSNAADYQLAQANAMQQAAFNAAQQNSMTSMNGFGGDGKMGNLQNANDNLYFLVLDKDHNIVHSKNLQVPANAKPQQQFQYINSFTGTDTKDTGDMTTLPAKVRRKLTRSQIPSKGIEA